MVGWPVLLWLLCTRRWRGVEHSWRPVVQLVAIWLYGWNVVRDYYAVIGPSVTKFAVRYVNYSLWTFGQRLFGQGTGDFTILLCLQARRGSSVCWCLAWQPCSCCGPRCVSKRSIPPMLLLCVGTLLNPVAWTHYLIVTALPIALLAQRYAARQWPLGMWLMALVGILSSSALVWSRMAIWGSSSALRPVQTQRPLCCHFGPD